MTHNWTYKKLGELVDVLNGYAFKSSNYVKDGIRVIRIANVQKGKIVDEAPAFYPLSVESELKRYMLHEDDILLSLTGNVGRVGLLPKDMLPAALNQRVACLRIKVDTLMFKFLYQFLNSDYFEQKCIESSRGIAQLNMSTEWLKDYLIPIPSLSEQESIVTELDAINHLIDLQEQQLCEYDRLAQSLFYSTFGDPIVNNKGWSCKKFSEAFKLKSGDGLPTNLFIDGPYPVYGGNGISGMHNTYNMDGDYIIIGRVGVYCGNVRHVIGKFWLTDNAFRLFYDNENNNSIFITSMLTYLNLNQYANQAAQPVISNVTLKDVSVIFPPLALQQSFAAQIEAIEQQKALVRRSLDETRTLLAARMQYYFE